MGLDSLKPETFREKHIYLKTQKEFLEQHKNDNIFAYRIVSLGSNCFARTVTTWWGRKPRKSQGELGCPFDLSNQPLQLIEKYIATDFKDYFSNLAFDAQQDVWTADKNIIFCHEPDCHADDRQKIIDRFSQRIENLRYILREETKPALFICYYTKAYNLAPQDINETHRLYNRLYEHLTKYRGERRFKFLIVDTYGEIEATQLNPEIELLSCGWLPSPYLWHIDECRYRTHGLKFEQQYIAKVIALTDELCSQQDK